MKEFNRDLTKRIDLKKPFVYYKNPGADKIEGLSQNDIASYENSDFLEPGFIFAGFDSKKKELLIPENRSTKSSYHITNDRNTSQAYENYDIQSSVDKFHTNLVQTTLDYIDKSSVEKIVISRKETVRIDAIDIYKVFLRLLNNYPNAFVYIWSHHETGVWMGASPETLISVNNNSFRTMALAGTKSYSGSLDETWGFKEQREQQLVTDYISEKLKNFNIRIGEPFTLRAGSVLHICSMIDGEMNNANQLSDLIKNLHPTPAICGIPMLLAKEFILKNENYDREYYTGYLGRIKSERSLKLFVNLRCMKVDNEHISLYVGGGITKESDPESEWEETCVKSHTMKSVLS